MKNPIIACLIGLMLIVSTGASLQPGKSAFYQAELIFPLESWHNHASAIVECPNGDLLVCWFH
ncbi:MAG TPA: neuraminidase (sialidase)-like protein, partial [Blastocatellia bacterium]|nr:neuraminidase (sialidase)-like protein [Blastocatellia bacterium]